MAEHGGSIAAGLAKIKARRTLVIGVETDILFPITYQQQIARLLQEQGLDVQYIALPSEQGHDSFQVDQARFAPVMAKFFNMYN